MRSITIFFIAGLALAPWLYIACSGRDSSASTIEMDEYCVPRDSVNRILFGCGFTPITVDAFWIASSDSIQQALCSGADLVHERLLYEAQIACQNPTGT